MKRKMWSAMILLLCGLSFYSCNMNRWTEFRGPGGQGRAASSIQPPLGIKWQLKLQKPDEDHRFFNQPLLVDNTIYFGSSDGNFYSLDLHSGYMNWTFRTEGSINAVASVAKDRVYIGSSDGFVYCLDREKGNELWRFETYGGVNSTLVEWGEGIIAASDADAFYYLSQDGELIYSIPNPVWYSNSFQIYRDILAFSPGTEANPHLLTAYNLAEERVIWALDAELQDYTWFSFPATRRNRLFYAAIGFDQNRTMVFRFSALNQQTGRELWTKRERGYLEGDMDGTLAVRLFREQRQLLDYAAPLVWRNQVIFAPGDQTLRSFNTSTGRKNWQKEYDLPLSTAPTLAGGRLYFGLRAPDEPESKGRLVCASPRNGKIFWDMEVEGSILNSPVIAGSWIIFGTDQGEFYVLEELW